VSLEALLFDPSDHSHVSQDCHNLVAIAAIQKNLSVQGAIDFVYSMILEAIARFWRERKKVPSFGEKADPIVSHYLRAVEIYTV
jgi:hypothetical protein